jgi:hypothetical protein
MKRSCKSPVRSPENQIGEITETVFHFCWRYYDQVVYQFLFLLRAVKPLYKPEIPENKGVINNLTTIAPTDITVSFIYSVLRTTYQP